ncbi:MAG: 3-deoxy-D-manno-octulosonic acid transferase [Acidobacteriota bacterium]
MFFLYSILLTAGFIVLLPRFIFDALFNGKYAGGFVERLGFIPKFDALGRPVVWIHCVSVGETNAARPLIEQIHKEHPEISLVISTTTATGQTLAREVFKDTADLIFYFPFDWRSTVNRTLKRIHPAAVLLVETEIWFNFIREASRSGARVAIVNGRLSERSFQRFRFIPRFIRRVLSYLDLAVMQDEADAKRMTSLGLHASKIKVTGNIKFDLELGGAESERTEELRSRFSVSPETPLIIAASTHQPEEAWILEAFKNIRDSGNGPMPRLIIAPRHPERFAAVAEIIQRSGFTWARRSGTVSTHDKTAEVILLDSIGELRSAYPLAEVVFVGGSLIPHGGQSIFEPAAAGRAIITGPHTANFAVAVAEFLDKDALIQLKDVPEARIVPELELAIKTLLLGPQRRSELASNALAVVQNNRGAVSRTLEHLRHILPTQETS